MYLLDTHILIWAIFSDDKLSKKVLRIINDQKNTLFYSAASIWEIAIKHSKSPEKIPVSADDVVAFCQRSGIQPLPIVTDHALAISSLARKPRAPKHSDPFDRLLIAQAKTAHLTLLTHDKLLMSYKELSIQLV